MDKSIRSFLVFALLQVLLFLFAISIFAYVYRNFTLDTYGSLLFVLIIFSTIIALIVSLSLLAIFHTYRGKKLNRMLLLPVRLGLKLVIPFSIAAAGLLRFDRDAIRAFYVEINNIIVQSLEYAYRADQVLVLLPHCLQHSECGCRITGDIANCISCGRCKVGAIKELIMEKGVRAVVVTGGTAARNLVGREKPSIILSVACERDLAIGISDVGSIPVVGVLNSRPNGPCVNTTVDVKLFKDKLEEILHRQKEIRKGI